MLVSQSAKFLLHSDSRRLGAALVAGLLFVYVADCQPEASGQSLAGPRVSQRGETVLEWIGSGGFSDWNCGGAYIFGTSTEPRTLEIWTWAEDTLARHNQRRLFKERLATCIGESRYLCATLAGNEPHGLHIKNVTTGATLWNWPYPTGWYCNIVGISRNGTQVAVCLFDEFGDNGAPGSDYDHPRVRLGLMETDATEIRWVATLVGDRSGADSTVRSVVPSDSGAYVAIVGWDNKLAVIDINAQKLLWADKPFNEAGLRYAAFSPDDKSVYAGGTMAVVYGMDARTGQVRSSWVASTTGKPEYGHRISSIAVSPDGRWVAAGTGPEGLVWIFRTSDGKQAAVLKHGGGTILLVHFSPDSKALATFVPGTLKVWDTTKWPAGAKPTSTAPASQPAD